MEQLQREFIPIVIDYGKALKKEDKFFFMMKESPFVRVDLKPAAGVDKIEFPVFTASTGTVPNGIDLRRPLNGFENVAFKTIDYIMEHKHLDYYSLAYRTDHRDMSKREVKGMRQRMLWDLRVSILAYIESLFAAELQDPTNYAADRVTDIAGQWANALVDPFTHATYGMNRVFHTMYADGMPVTDIIFGVSAWQVFFNNAIARQTIKGTGYAVTPGAFTDDEAAQAISTNNYGIKTRIWKGWGAWTASGLAPSATYGTRFDLWDDAVIFMHQPDNRTLAVSQTIGTGSATVADISAEDFGFAGFVIGDEGTNPISNIEAGYQGERYDVAGSGFRMAERAGYLFYDPATT
jgi:hypothetical protein